LLLTIEIITEKDENPIV